MFWVDKGECMRCALPPLVGATESAQRNEFWSMSRDCSGCITCGNH